MIKIGFIDYFLDGWHSDNYPAWIDQVGQGRFKVTSAYGDVEPPMEGKRSNAQFCKDHGIK